MKSLNQIIAELEAFATAHYQIHAFGHGDVWEISPQSDRIIYPLLWMVPQTATPTLHEVTQTFTVLCMDLVDSGERNETEVLSDTQRIILDVCTYYRQQHAQNYVIEFGGQITPFTEAHPERVSGNSISITIRQPFDYNACAIPADPIAPALPPCLPVTYTLINTATPPATLDSGSIPSGGTETIVAPPVTVLRDGQPYAVVPSDETVDVPSDCPPPPPCADATVNLNSTFMVNVPPGGTENIQVRQSSGSTQVGSKQGQHWRIGDSDIEINGTQVAAVKAEDGLDIPVIQDGNPVGAFDPNTNSWVIPPCGAGGSVSVSVSNATPSTGDAITITATPTGFTPTNHLFFTYDGATIGEIVEQSSGVYNWTVDRAGTYDIYVLATDGVISSYGTVNIVASSVFVLDQIVTQPVWAVSLRRLTVNYTGNAALVRRSSDNATLVVGFVGEDLDVAAVTAFVGVGNGFSATLYDQIGSLDGNQTTAGSQPAMVVSGTVQLLGGRPTLVFNGSSSSMSIGAGITFSHGFVVARSQRVAAIEWVLEGSVNGIYYGGTAGGFTTIGVLTAGGSLNSIVGDALPHQTSVRFGAAGAGRLRVDGVNQATGTTSASILVNSIGVRSSAAAQRLNGDFSEAILYAPVLSDADELLIENNQRAYYGL